MLKITSDQQKLEIVSLSQSGYCPTAIDRKLGLTQGISKGILVRRKIPINKAKRKYSFNEHIFDTIDTEDKAYWLGFLIADGSVVKNQLKFYIDEKDIEHMKKYKLFMKAEQPIGRNAKTLLGLSIGCKVFIPKLSKYSLIQNKTYKEITASNVPRKFLRHYYRGFLDGDGTIVESISKIRSSTFLFGFCCKCYNFLLELQNWICKVINQDCGSIVLRKNIKGSCYCLNFSGNNIFQKVYHLFYDNSTIYLERKKTKADGFMEKIYKIQNKS